MSSSSLPPEPWHSLNHLHTEIAATRHPQLNHLLPETLAARSPCCIQGAHCGLNPSTYSPQCSELGYLKIGAISFSRRFSA